ncbi:hypothetical protein [Thalassospira xiamenensis]|uniref:Uncharacterized protein n=1 Tax=Thalassospira xiamenensis TaxID=220697 RepID=A0A285U2Q0_9PROT|nr:hypothetical protein [Thalassospira xiamenensis]SOC30957.1 hypothetical protein SAMN05428964_11132 [Thalassospira xiamenensis]
MTSTSDLHKVVEFLADTVGLNATFEAGVSGFCDGVVIRAGSLVVDPQVCAIGDLLHEAGHVAITPGRYRRLMSDDLREGLKLMLDDVEKLGPDSEVFQPAMQCSDPEATAWAWAAGMHLGLKPEIIIEDDAYGSSGANVRSQLLSSELGRPYGRVTGYLGIHGLAHAGMTSLHNRGGAAMFPEMKRWRQIE